jgi:hypothetical protein
MSNIKAFMKSHPVPTHHLLGQYPHDVASPSMCDEAYRWTNSFSSN